METHDRTGWDATACSACGCQRLDVDYTYRRNGYRIRVRICQHCGKRIRTREVLDRPLAPAPQHAAAAR